MLLTHPLLGHRLAEVHLAVPTRDRERQQTARVNSFGCYGQA